MTQEGKGAPSKTARLPEDGGVEALKADFPVRADAWPGQRLHCLGFGVKSSTFLHLPFVNVVWAHWQPDPRWETQRSAGGYRATSSPAHGYGHLPAAAPPGTNPL